MVVAGDSVGGNMSAFLTLTAKERGDVRLLGQVLFYPVTDASFDTGSYQQFATGYGPRRDGMQWFWDQYTTDPNDRNMITASPLRATTRAAGRPSGGAGHHRRGRRAARRRRGLRQQAAGRRRAGHRHALPGHRP
jgi:acetyl esterase/lipase